MGVGFIFAFSYVYGLAGAGPHAVSQIGSALYSYDANGSMVSGDNKTTGWTSFNKPQVITDTLNSNESLFVYGPSRARVKHRITDGGLVTNMFYVGSHYERKVRSGEDDELVHYIRAGGAVVAIYTEYRDEFDAVTGDKTRYLHRDHLGSVESITDETGTVTERFSYDPHGKRRETDWTAAVATISGTETPRGFTGHEHLDAVGLIHMNGRVYDPTLGRFLSADPYVQDPHSIDGFNRYSYVCNNPLGLTDPTGFQAVGAGPILLDPIIVEAPALQRPQFGGDIFINGDLYLGPGNRLSQSYWYNIHVTGNVYVLGNGGDGYSRLVEYNERIELQGDFQAGGSGTSSLTTAADVSAQSATTFSSAASQVEGAAAESPPSGFLSVAHTVAEIASFAPGPIGSLAIVLDAGLYAYEGDYATAAMNVGIAGAGLFASAGAIKLATVAGKRLIKAANRTRSAESAAVRGPTGQFYSVAHEMKLSPTSYPGASRASHFREANESLLRAMEGDATLAHGMQRLGINLHRMPTGLRPAPPPLAGLGTTLRPPV